VFLLGTWKNYEELEYSLTLDELLDIYKGIVERETRQTKTQARLMGVEPLEDDEETEPEEPKQESTAERIARRAKERVEQDNVKQGAPPQNFGAGMGYRRI
jgi:hypothetical protein